MGAAWPSRHLRRAGGSATGDRGGSPSSPRTTCGSPARGARRVSSSTAPCVRTGSRSTSPPSTRRRSRRSSPGGPGDARGDRGRRGDPRIDLRLRPTAGTGRAAGARAREAHPDRRGLAGRAGRCFGAPRVEGDGAADRRHTRAVRAGPSGRGRFDDIRFAPARHPAAPSSGPRRLPPRPGAFAGRDPVLPRGRCGAPPRPAEGALR